jgi:hypothetical protein
MHKINWIIGIAYRKCFILFISVFHPILPSLIFIYFFLNLLISFFVPPSLAFVPFFSPFIYNLIVVIECLLVALPFASLSNCGLLFLLTEIMPSGGVID